MSYLGNALNSYAPDSGSVWLTYAFPTDSLLHGWRAGDGVFAAGNRWGDDPTPLSSPPMPASTPSPNINSVWAGAKWSAQINLKNIANTKYYPGNDVFFNNSGASQIWDLARRSARRHRVAQSGVLAMARRLFVLLHRWTGLLMTSFLVVVGLTGSLLAFNSELERLISPQLYAAPKPGAVPLDAAALALRAEALVPKGQVYSVSFAEPDQVLVTMGPREGIGSRSLSTLGFNQLFLDPYTGDELGRRSWGAISEGWINLMPFIYSLHFKLALGVTGLWIMGIVATGLDAGLLRRVLSHAAGFLAAANFWRHWTTRLARQMEGAARLSHQFRSAPRRRPVAVGDAAHLRLVQRLHEFGGHGLHLGHAGRSRLPAQPDRAARPAAANETPRLDWRAALSTGERLMAKQAGRSTVLLSSVRWGFLSTR